MSLVFAFYGPYMTPMVTVPRFCRVVIWTIFKETSFPVEWICLSYHNRFVFVFGTFHADSITTRSLELKRVNPYARLTSLANTLIYARPPLEQRIPCSLACSSANPYPKFASSLSPLPDLHSLFHAVASVLTSWLFAAPSCLPKQSLLHTCHPVMTNGTMAPLTISPCFLSFGSRKRSQGFQTAGEISNLDDAYQEFHTLNSGFRDMKQDYLEKPLCLRMRTYVTTHLSF